MAENLRYGTIIPTDREQTDNDTVEMYRLSQLELWDTVGGIYRWFEAMNYRVNDPKGICPDGWHLPTWKEWKDLFLSYPQAYPLQYYGKDGLSKLNLDLVNGGIRKDGNFQEESLLNRNLIGYWSSSYEIENQLYQPWFCFFCSQYFSQGVGHLDETVMAHSRYYSVRCIKDK